jgi:hypothetical protein
VASHVAEAACAEDAVNHIARSGVARAWKGIDGKERLETAAVVVMKRLFLDFMVVFCCLRCFPGDFCAPSSDTYGDVHQIFGSCHVVQIHNCSREQNIPGADPYVCQGTPFLTADERRYTQMKNTDQGSVLFQFICVHPVHL